MLETLSNSDNNRIKFSFLRGGIVLKKKKKKQTREINFRRHSKSNEKYIQK